MDDPAPLEGPIPLVCGGKLLGSIITDCSLIVSSSQRYSSWCSANFLDRLPKVPLRSSTQAFIQHKTQPRMRWHSSCFQSSEPQRGEIVLKVVIDKIGEVAVVECQGRIVKSEAGLNLRKVVTSLGDTRIIVLDLSEVTAIEADGLGMLLFLPQWASEQGIQLKLFNPTTSVLDSLELVIRSFDIVS
jgi:anti-anti-sigma regulatory factor